MEETKELSDKEASRLFWADYNVVCKHCVNKCKQSYKVDLLRCEEYQEKPEKN